MPDDDKQQPDEEFLAMLREMLSNQSGMDPQQLANAAGLPNDPEQIAQLIPQLQGALQTSGDGINWGLALDQAKARAVLEPTTGADGSMESLEQAFNVAALWLGEATGISELTASPRLVSRTEWIEATM